MEDTELYPQVKTFFGSIEYSYPHELLTLEEGVSIKTRIIYSKAEAKEIRDFLNKLDLD